MKHLSGFHLGLSLAGLLLVLAAHGCGEDAGEPVNPLDKIAQVTAGPYQLRPTADSVEIRWETDLEASSRVVWGVGEALSRTAVGEILEEDYEGVTEEEMKPPPGFRHRVIVSGLEADQTYSYRIASAAEPPPAGRLQPALGPADPLRMVVFGDTRTNDDDHRAVVEAIVDQDPDAVLHVGDFAAHSWEDEHWSRFFTIEAEMMRDRPFFPVFGNHEWYQYGWYKYRSYIGAFPDSGTDRYYAFDYGPVHGIVLDTEDKPYDDSERGQAQATWLEAELARVSARAEPPILLVFFHRPLYTFSGAGPSKPLRSKLRPLFQQHGVDGVFWGHEHCYERFDIEGVPYVTTGGGGAPLHVPDPPSGNDADLWVTSESALNYLLLEGDATGLDVKVYLVPDDELFDSFRLTP